METERLRMVPTALIQRYLSKPIGIQKEKKIGVTITPFTLFQYFAVLEVHTPSPFDMTGPLADDLRTMEIFVTAPFEILEFPMGGTY